MAQPSKIPMQRTITVGIHIQLITPIIPPPIMLPYSLTPVIDKLPNSRKSTTTMTKTMIRGVLLLVFIYFTTSRLIGEQGYAGGEAARITLSSLAYWGDTLFLFRTDLLGYEEFIEQGAVMNQCLP